MTEESQYAKQYTKQNPNQEDPNQEDPNQEGSSREGSNREGSNHHSIWQQSVIIPKRPVLPGNMEADTVIIGGGLTGILTAYYLQQSGKECVVLEADRIGGGQTAHTTAKVTSQHNLIYQKLMKAIGKERAAQYAKANEQAIRAYRDLIDKYGIDCDWRTSDAYLYTRKDDKQARALRDECRIAKELHLPAELTTQTELPFEVKEALGFHEQACFHPLKFLAAISEKVTVYERTKVLEVVPMQHANAVITNRGTVQAKYVIFACHYPFINRPGYYFLRMHQERSYVLALKKPGHLPVQHMYLGVDDDALSFRSASIPDPAADSEGRSNKISDILLLGGGSHRTGENQGNQYEYLQKQADRYWPDWDVAAMWSAQDCMTLDDIPYIGKFGMLTNNWYVATGYGKWGMTSAMAAAHLITNLINGQENGAEKVYCPQRKTIAASAKTFVTEGKYATVNILKEKWGRTDEKRENPGSRSRRQKTPANSERMFQDEVERMHPGESKLLEYEGEKVGVYKNETGTVYIVTVKCPHLGCQLAWNADEKSWDCPCHGSRFSYSGELLDGPAQTGNACKWGDAETKRQI